MSDSLPSAEGTSVPEWARQPSRFKKRSIKLILPTMQLRLIGYFAGASLLSLGLQYLLFSQAMSSLASELPRDGVFVLERLPRILAGVFLTSAALIFPVIAWIGLQTTFRFAGPLYRFERHLAGVVEEGQSEACKLRRGDQLQHLCRLMNEATRAQREANAAAKTASDEAEAGTQDPGAQAPTGQATKLRRVA